MATNKNFLVKNGLEVGGNISGATYTGITLGGSLAGDYSDAKIVYSSTAPETPTQGAFYFDSLNQKMKVYTGSAWVDAVPSSGGGGVLVASDAIATLRKYTYTTAGTTNIVSGAEDDAVVATEIIGTRLYEITTVGDTDFTLIGASANTVGVSFVSTDVGTGTGTATEVLNYAVDSSQNVEVFVNGIKQVEGSGNDYVATTGTSVSFTYNLAADFVVDVQVYEVITSDNIYLKTEVYTQTETDDLIATGRGTAGNAMLAAETPQAQRDLIGAGRRNLIINGGFDVWQRGTSSTTPASGSVYRTLDRFWTLNSAGAAGTHSRSSDVPSGEGLNYSLSMTNVSGGYIGTSVELTETGKASPFKPNTDYTLSFWLKGTGGTLGAHYRNATASGTNSTEVQSAVTFASSVDWVRHSLTFNTGNVYPHANNTHIGFDLSGFTSGGLTTGWQLELGSVATDFEHRSYGEELALCQRYYEKWDYVMTFPIVSSDSTSRYLQIEMVEKRAVPSVSVAAWNHSGITFASRTVGKNIARGDVYNLPATNSYAQAIDIVADAEL